jgi:hypothetical protein
MHINLNARTRNGSITDQDAVESNDSIIQVIQEKIHVSC